jgi:tetratricopeptide (TPR) repeat protein
VPVSWGRVSPEDRTSAPRPPAAARAVAPLLLVILSGLAASLVACEPARPGLPPPEPFAAPEGLPPAVVKAIEAARVASEAAPHDRDARLDLARTYLANGFPQAAIAEAKSVLALDGEQARARYVRALAEDAAGDRAAALESLERVRAVEPGHAAAAWRAAFWLLDDGELDAARELFARALAIEPRQPLATLGGARAALEAGDAAAAITMLEAMPPMPYRDGLLASAYRVSGRAADAERLAAGPMPMAPPLEDAWEREVAARAVTRERTIARLDALLAAGRPADAAVAAREALADWPADPLMLDRLSRARRAQGDLAGAIDALREASEAAPGDHPTWVNLGDLHLAARDIDGAERAARRAVSTAPGLPAGHELLAAVAVARTDWAAARASFLEADRLGGLREAPARLRLSLTFLRLGEAARAERAAFLVIEADRTNDAAWALMAEAIDAQGDRAKAIAATIKGLEFVPKSQLLRSTQSAIRARPPAGDASR